MFAYQEGNVFWEILLFDNIGKKKKLYQQITLIQQNAIFKLCDLMNSILNLLFFKKKRIKTKLIWNKVFFND